LWTKLRRQRVYKVVVRQRIVGKIPEIPNRSIQNKAIRKERAHPMMSRFQTRNKIRRLMQVPGCLVIYPDSIRSKEEQERIMIITTTISMILKISRVRVNQIRKVINTRMR